MAGLDPLKGKELSRYSVNNFYIYMEKVEAERQKQESQKAQRGHKGTNPNLSRG